jgi:hypothetical protein
MVKKLAPRAIALAPSRPPLMPPDAMTKPVYADLTSQMEAAVGMPHVLKVSAAL